MLLICDILLNIYIKYGIYTLYVLDRNSKLTFVFSYYGL